MAAQWSDVDNCERALEDLAKEVNTWPILWSMTMGGAS